MAWEQVVEGLEWAENAGANLAGKVHYIVKYDTNGAIVLAAAATDKILGVLREDGASGKPVTVQFGGVGKVIAGGTIAAGDLLTSDGSGQAVATTSAGNRIIGIALMAADSGDIISAALMPGSV